MKKKNVGIFIFDEVEVLDFCGPFEIFSAARKSISSIAKIHNLPQAFNVFTFTENKLYKIYPYILYDYQDHQHIKLLEIY